jgi:hypothetical protein
VRALSAILDDIAREALAAGDQPILELVEEASSLLDAHWFKVRDTAELIDADSDAFPAGAADALRLMEPRS